ncbi:MAG: thiamine pyrophosphate-binding protein [Cellvibrionaceae bacterium]|nr:thiamine pyrophosphate-binding protein [Cellvibrionaceae bacterium]
MKQSIKHPASTQTHHTINNVAELVVDYLEHLGINCIFGLPGGAIEPLYNAFARSEKRKGARIINACHETGAAYMADGYARETGKIGVCLATSGPGATNLITGVACAYDNHIPLLVITGQPAIHAFGRGALQESSCTGVNVIEMFRHCTHYNSLISHENQLQTKLAHALLSARKQQGPVHLSIPVDILRRSANQSMPCADLINKLNHRAELIDKASIKKLYRLLCKKQGNLFFIGNGAGEAIDAIMYLIDQTQSLFVTTADAKGLINSLHPAYRGVFGLGGHQSAIKTLQNTGGYIIAFGTGFGELASNAWSEDLLNDQLIHIDEINHNLLQSPMAKLHVQGNMLMICTYLIEHLKAGRPLPTKTPPKVVSASSANHVTLQEPDKYRSDASPIKPQRLMKELSERFPASTRFLADAGNSMMWAPHYLQPKNRRLQHDYRRSHHQGSDRRSACNNWLRLTLNFAPMGWAIGAAVGISRANSQRPTVCITGDGAYLMSGQEMGVAAKEKLPIIYIILNDGVYGMVMHGQRLAGAEATGFHLPAIDFSQMAAAMKIPAYIIKSPTDFENINIERLTTRRGPSLLDVRIDREEVPPMAMRLKTLDSLKK